jgi:alanine dehydrogenase
VSTLLLTRSEVERSLDPATLVSELRAAFRAYSATPGLRAERVRSSLPGPGTATVLFPGVVTGIPAYTVKVHAKFPEQRPAIRGAAWQAYQTARSRGAGREVEFLT